jgi:hypothetical protein
MTKWQKSADNETYIREINMITKVTDVPFKDKAPMVRI